MNKGINIYLLLYAKMKMLLKNYRKYIHCFVFFILLIFPRKSVGPHSREIPWDTDSFDGFSIQLLRKKLQNKDKFWPSTLHFENKEYALEYTLNENLTSYILDLLNQFRSDYSSVVVIDNNTGQILSAVDHGREEGDLGLSLTFAGNHPSASLFKIITTATLLNQGKVQKDSLFKYLGRSTTLFKYQLKQRPLTHWTREESFMQAFARSNNVIFGKAALNFANKDSLFKMAQDLGFYEDLMQELPLPMSSLYFPNDAFGLAELASGFNRDTVMTPIHGALLSSIVANEGLLRYPRVVSRVRQRDGGIVWEPSKRERKALSPRVAKDIQEMMELTVRKGTAKRVFRTLNKKFINSIRIGGKTGSITGGEPFGKRDWFTAYAFPVNKDEYPGTGKGISVCVMIINQKKWYVKSTFLAKRIIEYYYEILLPSLGRYDHKKVSKKQSV